jgi:DNA repair ATPase RecN
MSATGSITHGFSGDIEARLQKLQEIARRHEDRLDGLDNLIRSETKERSALRAIEQGLQEKINEVAANGLTVESWEWPFSASGLC